MFGPKIKRKKIWFFVTLQKYKVEEHPPRVETPRMKLIEKRPMALVRNVYEHVLSNYKMADDRRGRWGSSKVGVADYLK